MTCMIINSVLEETIDMMIVILVASFFLQFDRIEAQLKESITTNVAKLMKEHFV